MTAVIRTAPHAPAAESESGAIAGAAGDGVLPGFEAPVFDAAHSFRALMEAMARPGTIQRPVAPQAVPPGLPESAAAALLTLVDYETPVWIDPALAEGATTPTPLDPAAVAAYLAFHTGATTAASPEDAAFALTAADGLAALLPRLPVGDPAYPDRSATAIALSAGLGRGREVTLTGPGIDGSRRFAFAELDDRFRAAAADNAALFPLGVDMILAGPEGVAALPRTTRMEA